MHPDRRRFLRVAAVLPGRCSRIAADGSRGDAFAVETDNVSAGGARLRPAQPVEPGELLWIELEFDRPRLLLFCEARVVWSRADPPAAGVGFVDVDRYVEQRIVRWVYAEDRRIFDRRAQARIPVRLKVICDTGTERFAAPTLDVSGDGARIVTDRELRPGERLRLEISFPDREPPGTYEATVVWRGDDDARTAYGLRFEALSHASRRRLIERCVAAEAAQRQ
jgi:c-di-GMP-binding flagellar brake protein YcgR